MNYSGISWFVPSYRTMSTTTTTTTTRLRLSTRLAIKLYNAAVKSQLKQILCMSAVNFLQLVANNDYSPVENLGRQARNCHLNLKL